MHGTHNSNTNCFRLSFPPRSNFDCHRRVQQAQTSWGEFKADAAAKLGVQAGTQALAFFWEDCQIEEEDDRAVGMIAKDGDMLTLVPAGTCTVSGQHAGLVAAQQAMPLLGRALAMERPAAADDVTAAGTGAGRVQRAASNGSLNRRQYASGNDSADEQGSRGHADTGE